MEDGGDRPPRPRTASSVRSNEHIRRALAFEREQLLRSRKKAMADKSGARKTSARRRGSFGSVGESAAPRGEHSSSVDALHHSASASATTKRPSTSGGRQRQRNGSSSNNSNNNNNDFTKWLAATLPAAPITGISGSRMFDDAASSMPRVGSSSQSEAATTAQRQHYSLFVWGQNGQGQCGSSCTKLHLTRPRRLGQHHLRVHSVAAGSECSLAVAEGGSMVAWGVLSKEFAAASAASKSPAVDGFGSGVRDPSKEQLFRKGPAPNTVVCIHPVAAPGFGDYRIFEVAAQSDGLCVAITTRLGTISWTMEKLLKGGAADDRGPPRQRTQNPSPVRGLEHVAVSTVACGRSHTIALSCAGGLYGWGSNKHGQLGRRSNSIQNEGNVRGNESGSTLMVDLGPGTYGRLIACGNDHTLVLAYNSNLGRQQLFAFGAADLGQLGLGSVSTSLQSSAMPTVSFPSRPLAAQEGNAASAGQHHQGYPLIATIAAGGNSSFCLTESGVAFAWGENHCGQLGLGNTTTQHAPAVIQAFVDVGVKVETMSCSGDCTAAVSTAGNVYTWGQTRARTSSSANSTTTTTSAINGSSTSEVALPTAPPLDTADSCELVPRLVELFAAKNLRIAGVWAGRGSQFVAAVQSLAGRGSSSQANAMPEKQGALPSAPKCVALFQSPKKCEKQQEQQQPPDEMLQSATVDEWTSYLVELRDFRGDRVHTGGWRMSVSLYCSEKGSPLRGRANSLSPDADTDVVDNWDGTYQVRFRSRAVGIHQLHVRLHEHLAAPLGGEASGWEGDELASGGMHIHRSPFQVLVQEAKQPLTILDCFSFDVSLMPNAKEDGDGRGGLMSMVAQHDRSIAIVRVSLREGSISARTDVSTLWTALQLSAETTLTDGLSVPREELNCTVQRAAKDRFLVAYPARHVGTFSLILSASITWSDVSPPPAITAAATQILPGCPFLYSITPGPLCSRTTTLRLDASDNAASGKVILLDARDELGNPVTEDITSGLLVEASQVGQSGAALTVKTTLEPPPSGVARTLAGEWRMILTPTEEAHSIKLHVRVRDASPSRGRTMDVVGSPMTIDLLSAAKGHSMLSSLKAQGWLWDTRLAKPRCSYCSSAPGKIISFGMDLTTIKPLSLEMSDAKDIEALQNLVESAVQVRAIDARSGSQTGLDVVGSFEWTMSSKSPSATSLAFCIFTAAAPAELGVYLLDVALGTAPASPSVTTSPSGVQLTVSVVDAAVQSFQRHQSIDSDLCLFRDFGDSDEAFHFTIHTSSTAAPALAWLAHPRTLESLAADDAAAATITTSCPLRTISEYIVPLANISHGASWGGCGGGLTDASGVGGSDADAAVVKLCIAFDITVDTLLERLVGYARHAVARVPSGDDSASFRARVHAIASLVAASVGASIWDSPPDELQDEVEGDEDAAEDGARAGEGRILSSFRCVLVGAGELCREMVSATRRGEPVPASMAYVRFRAVLFKYLCDVVDIQCGIGLLGSVARQGRQGATCHGGTPPLIWVAQGPSMAAQEQFSVDLDKAPHETCLRLYGDERG